MKMFNTGFLVLALTLVSTSILSTAKADETIGHQIDDKAGDVKTDMKKGKRSVKQKARKANGTDNVAKDAKDKMNDAGDDVSNGANKLKNKAD